MKATKAYIASLGTTGVLLAASLLMLAVVSAVVAFDRWPGANAQTPVQTLVLNEKAPAIRVSAKSTGPSATPARTGASVPALARVPRTTLGAGGVAGQRVTSTPGGPAATVPGAPQLPKAPDVPPVPSPDNVIDSISNPGTTASQVADGAQAVTDQAGVSVGRVSPDVGNTVAVTGEQLSQTIRELPLPNGVIPGH